MRRTSKRREPYRPWPDLRCSSRARIAAVTDYLRSEPAQAVSIGRSGFGFGEEPRCVAPLAEKVGDARGPQVGQPSGRQRRDRLLFHVRGDPRAATLEPTACPPPEFEIRRPP